MTFFKFLLTPATLLCLVMSVSRADDSGLQLDLDALYAEPSLIGTRPTSITWSDDGTQLLFAWNDEGWPFRDVWRFTAGDSSPVRLTRHADHAAVAWNTPGVAEIVWIDAGLGQYSYTLNGALYSANPDSADSKPVAEGGIRQLALSPDQKWVSYVSGSGMHLSQVTEGNLGDQQLLMAVTEPGHRISSYQWLPDSSGLVFQLADISPLPERDIHFYTREGHQKITVSRAFPGQDTQNNRLGVISIEDSQPRYFSRNNDRDYIWNYGVSSDSERVFINGSDLLIKHHRIDVYDINSGERTLFYQEKDPLHVRPDWRAAWAPGDEGLVILTDRDGYLHLYQVPAAMAEPRQITSGEWEIASFEIDHRARELHFRANRDGHGDRQMYTVPFDGGEVKLIGKSGPGHYFPERAPNGRQLAYVHSDDQTPHELYVLDRETGSTQQVTRSPRESFYEQTWANVSYIEFPSHKDGETLVGRLSLPPNHDPEKRYPLIVGSVYSDSVLNQWGGRQSHPTWGLDQHLVSQGYILLNVNIRGSWGQGRKHNQAQRYGYGVVDIEDLHSGVIHLVSEGLVDKDRVGIWGSSYGGLMTMMSLFKKPGVYAAGVAGAPATNVAHAYPGQMWIMGTPEGDDQPGRYQSQSPLYHSDGLEDPLMIIHGTRDQVVLYSDTMAVVGNLIENEQDFELVSLPGTGHGWDAEDPQTRRFTFRKMVEFFDRHLK